MDTWPTVPVDACVHWSNSTLFTCYNFIKDRQSNLDNYKRLIDRLFRGHHHKVTFTHLKKPIRNSICLIFPFVTFVNLWKKVHFIRNSDVPMFKRIVQIVLSAPSSHIVLYQYWTSNIKSQTYFTPWLHIFYRLKVYIKRQRLRITSLGYQPKQTPFGVIGTI